MGLKPSVDHPANVHISINLQSSHPNGGMSACTLVGEMLQRHSSRLSLRSVIVMLAGVATALWQMCSTNWSKTADCII